MLLRNIPKNYYKACLGVKQLSQKKCKVSKNQTSKQEPNALIAGPSRNFHQSCFSLGCSPLANHLLRRAGLRSRLSLWKSAIPNQQLEEQKTRKVVAWHGPCPTTVASQPEKQTIIILSNLKVSQSDGIFRYC